MHSKIIQKAIISLAYRYIVFVISVCSVLSAYAQQNISQLIDEVIESHDAEKEKMLMKQIKESDIANMSDSTLISYYFLASQYFSDIKEYEKKIDYLIKAKELCETKIGITNCNIDYFDIIESIGNTYEILDQDDEALLWYEDGIVKALSYLSTEDKDLQIVIKSLLDNTANIYAKKGHTDLAEFLRTYESPYYVGSLNYATNLYRKASQFYLEKKYAEAISILNEVEYIYKRNYDAYGIETEKRSAMLNIYRMFFKCYAGMGDTKRIDALLRTKSGILFYVKTKSSFIDFFYNDVISTFILDHHDIKTAEYYYNKLQKQSGAHNQHNSQILNDIDKKMRAYRKLFLDIDSLENVRKYLPELSYEWGNVSLELSYILIVLKKYDEANKICEQVYEMSATLNKDPQKIHWKVLGHLERINNDNNKFNKAEQYMNEQLAWLDARGFSSEAEERGIIYNNLGILYLKTKRYIESRNLLNKTDKIFLSIYGRQSVKYATLLHNKGRLAQLEGKFDEAKQYFEESVKIQIELDGKAMDKTIQYLDEVNHSIKVHL